MRPTTASSRATRFGMVGMGVLWPRGIQPRWGQPKWTSIPEDPSKGGIHPGRSIQGVSLRKRVIQMDLTQGDLSEGVHLRGSSKRDPSIGVHQEDSSKRTHPREVNSVGIHQCGSIKGIHLRGAVNEGPSQGC